jgi:hypothetical protein
MRATNQLDIIIPPLGCQDSPPGLLPWVRLSSEPVNGLPIFVIITLDIFTSHIRYNAKTLYKKTETGVERLWWSFCLVWRPSLQEFPGLSHLLISHSTKHWLLLDLLLIKPVYDYFLASVWALGKYCFVQML